MGKSTIMTGVAIANSMIGTSMILFPVTFNQTGILVNVLFCVRPHTLRSSWRPSWLSPANCSSCIFSLTKQRLASPSKENWGLLSVPLLPSSALWLYFWSPLSSSSWLLTSSTTPSRTSSVQIRPFRWASLLRKDISTGSYGNIRPVELPPRSKIRLQSYPNSHGSFGPFHSHHHHFHSIQPWQYRQRFLQNKIPHSKINPFCCCHQRLLIRQSSQHLTHDQVKLKTTRKCQSCVHCICYSNAFVCRGGSFRSTFDIWTSTCYR